MPSKVRIMDFSMGHHVPFTPISNSFTAYYMSFRHGLQTYITDPNQELVLFHDDDYVIMADGFPKSLRHYLVLPRSKALTHQHPVDALSSVAVYEKASLYVEKAKDMIIEDLTQKGYIENDKAAQEIFRNTFIKAGVHSVPSMANLHIHVITQDFYLPRLKHKKHYNSFTTPFFVEFDTLEPSTRDVGGLSGSDSDSHSDGLVEELLLGGGRRNKKKLAQRVDVPDLEKLLVTTPLKCVYCGRNFGTQFKALKKHLEEEFRKKFNR